MNEEKKFFVKDFIQYCSPCFSCGTAMNFRFGFMEKGKEFPKFGTYKTIVTDKYVEVELHIRYRSNLKLYIYHKNHKIVTTNDSAFSQYLVTHQLYLVCDCSVCTTEFTSRPLDFQTFNKIVLPTTLRYEYLVINEGNRHYELLSDFDEATSQGTLRKMVAPGISTPDLIFNMKLLPKYKIKDKQRLIDKFNIYAIFS